MADPTPTPTPAPKAKQHHGPINRQYLAEIANARAVAAAAIDTAHTAALTAVDFDATLPAQITALADSTETAIARLPGVRAQKADMTAQEIADRDAMVLLIAPIQTAAKRKYTGDHETLRRAYFIGNNLPASTLYVVHTAAVAIRDRLVAGPGNTPPADVLPGVKPAQITALSNAITLYAADLFTPDQQQNQNTGALEAVAAAIVKLAKMRHKVQLAADQAWPWRASGVASIRQSFLLPTDRPLTS